MKKYILLILILLMNCSNPTEPKTEVRPLCKGQCAGMNEPSSSSISSVSSSSSSSLPIAVSIAKRSSSSYRVAVSSSSQTTVISSLRNYSSDLILSSSAPESSSSAVFWSDTVINYLKCSDKEHFILKTYMGDFTVKIKSVCQNNIQNIYVKNYKDSVLTGCQYQYIKIDSGDLKTLTVSNISEDSTENFIYFYDGRTAGNNPIKPCYTMFKEPLFYRDYE